MIPLYFSSLKELSGQEASILSYIDPLMAVLVSVVVLHEGITPPQIVGGGLILGGVYGYSRIEGKDGN